MLTLASLLDLIQLERLETRYFRGQNYRAPWGRVFGGQVLAQALNAATQTVPEDRIAHSMHGYFILPGDIETPVFYEVDPIRDGGSFTTRRVVAWQHGRAIFNMSASFQLQQEGFGHQQTMPEATPPEQLLSYEDLAKQVLEERPDIAQRIKAVLPQGFDFRPVDQVQFYEPVKRPAARQIWLKAIEDLNLTPAQHQQLFACLSDYSLLYTAYLPHITPENAGKVLFASLDHALWFHRDFRLTDWHLYDMRSPSASNARGFAEGKLYTQTGKLVASVAQEGLIRVKE